MTNENYNKLREIRNKHFEPKLEFGITVAIGTIGEDLPTEYKVIGFTRINEKTTYPFDLKLLYKEDDLFYPTTNLDGHWGKGIENIGWENLGKEITLNEILLMIRDKGRTDAGKYHKLLYTTGELYNEVDDETGITFDLTKSIKNQSEEVIKKIIKLVE